MVFSGAHIGAGQRARCCPYWDGTKSMITFFTTAKPFTGHNGVIQRNALKSWTLVAPGAEVILFGKEEGAAKRRSELKTRKVAVAKVRAATPEFLMVGRRWDTDVTEPIGFEQAGWKEILRGRALTQGQQRSGAWIDYFVFRKGFYLGKMPELVIGRVHWDQWLVWKARAMGAVVVDASEAVMAIHQNHDYGYHPAGKTGVWNDELSRRNYRLAGGRWHLRTIDDATHVLSPNGLKANEARTRRAVERFFRTAKDAAWMTAMDWTRPVRSAVGLRKKSAERAEKVSR